MRCTLYKTTKVTYHGGMKNHNAQSFADHRAYCHYCPGYCCYKTEKATLFITAEDINRLARHFQISDGEVRRRYIQGKNTFHTREDGSCIFLSNGKLCKRCSIHTARPRQCMDFPYNEPCPYLQRIDLLDKIYPLFAASLRNDD